MKGYLYLLSTPLIVLGVVDTSGNFKMTDVSRVRGDSRAPVRQQPADLQIMQSRETLSIVPAVAPAKTSSRAFSKADPGRRYAAAEIASPVSFTADLPVVGATITITPVSPGSGVIALPAPTTNEPVSRASSATEIMTAGTSTKFTQPAAVSIADVPQVEQITLSILATDKTVGSLPESMTRVTKGTTTRVSPANVAATALKAANLGIGNGQSVMGKTSPVELISMIYGTSARNAHKVYFPKQFERSAGALDIDSGMEAGSVKPGPRALTMKGGYYHFEDTANGEFANTNQLNGSDTALKGNRSDQPKSSLNEKALTLSEQSDAALEIVSLNQSMETGNVY